MEEIDIQDAGDEDIGILLIGNTGSGKSATGNSILGFPAFQSRGGQVSVTRRHHVDMTYINGRAVKVVDTPGFNDTELNTKKERLNLVIDEITQALVQFPFGFNVVVPVISYIGRLCSEHEKTVHTMISLLGYEALERHGILVITGGDSYKRDFPGENMNASQWLSDLPLGLQWVQDICEERCVIFDNVTQDPEVKIRQREALMDCVDNVGTNARYIPDICTVQIKRRHTALRDSEQVMKYIKAQRILGIYKFKMQMAILDETFFDIDTELRFKEEGRRVISVLTDNQVFDISYSQLQNLSTQINSLDHTNSAVQNIANDMYETMDSLKLSIDTKIASTIYWQNLRQRVAVFFSNLYSKCDVL